MVAQERADEEPASDVAVYIAYVDDSGDEAVSWHSALLVPVEHWNECLNQWKKYRRALKRKHDVAPEFELHAVLRIPGKGCRTTGCAYQHGAGTPSRVGSRSSPGGERHAGLAVFTSETKTAIKRDAYVDFLASLPRFFATVTSCPDAVG